MIELEKDIVDLIRAKGFNSYVISAELDYQAITAGKDNIVFVASGNGSSSNLAIGKATTIYSDSYIDIVCIIMGKTVEIVKNIDKELHGLVKFYGSAKFGFVSTRMDANVYFENVSSQNINFSENLRKAFTLDNSRVTVIKLRYLN